MLEAKNIPPCLDSLRLHTSRATWQSFVWINYMTTKPEIPSPLVNGWEMKEDESISIKWNTVKPAPKQILKFMYCTCSKKCVFEFCAFKMDYSALTYAQK